MLLKRLLDKQEEQQDAIGTAGSDDAYNELNDILTKWANINQRVYFEHEDKIGVDKPFSNKLKSVQTSLGYAMSEIIGNDKRTTPEQYEAMTQTLMTGNPVFVENFTKAETQGIKDKMFQKSSEIANKKKDISRIKSDIIDAYKDPYDATKSILIDPSSPNFEEQIKNCLTNQYNDNNKIEEQYSTSMKKLLHVDKYFTENFSKDNLDFEITKFMEIFDITRESIYINKIKAVNVYTFTIFLMILSLILQYGLISFLKKES